MAHVRELVEAELENVERTIAELPDNDSLSNLSTLELAGVATLIHNFYNGIENILKQIVISLGQKIPCGQFWHQDLVKIATSSGIISESTAKELRRYLAFRHFFSHSYSFDLDNERIVPLVKDIPRILTYFTDDINKMLKKL